MGKSISNQIERWPDGYLDIFLLKSRVAKEIVESYRSVSPSNRS